MRDTRRVMLLEFNELSPQLMDRFITEGHLPNFRRLREDSQVYVTEAAERGWHLNPWIQWVTVHSGLDYSRHGVTELDEGTKLKAQRIWDVVSAAGLSVWVCGSMNVAYNAPVNGVVMPDPWTTKVAPFPDTLRPFFRFVQKHVVDHTKDSLPLSRTDYARFVAFMLRHGLSAATVKAIVRQLLAERKGDHRWRRAALLDKLQFDIFRWYYRKTRPHFSTFFSNSTAHFQHYYWRDMEPELFRVHSSEDKRAAHESAILFGYQEMDTLIGRFMELAGPETTLVFATALSQQPCLIYEEQGGKVMYRPHDFTRLMAFAGVTEPHTVAPVMAEVFNIHVTSEDDVARVIARLGALRVDGQPVMQLLRDGGVINAKCQLHTKLGPDTRLHRGEGSAAEPFFDFFYQIEDAKSGMHHPDGMLWIRLPGRKHREHEGKVPLTSIAPTILDLLALPFPAHMTARPLRI